MEKVLDSVAFIFKSSAVRILDFFIICVSVSAATYSTSVGATSVVGKAIEMRDAIKFEQMIDVNV